MRVLNIGFDKIHCEKILNYIFLILTTCIDFVINCTILTCVGRDQGHGGIKRGKNEVRRDRL